MAAHAMEPLRSKRNKGTRGRVETEVCTVVTVDLAVAAKHTKFIALRDDKQFAREISVTVPEKPWFL
jgi:hypothetical protein